MVLQMPRSMLFMCVASHRVVHLTRIIHIFLDLATKPEPTDPGSTLDHCTSVTTKNSLLHTVLTCHDTHGNHEYESAFHFLIRIKLTKE